MTYQPRNRRLCKPDDLAFTVGEARVPYYIDDADEVGGSIKPFSWGREGSVVTVTTYIGRFTLCDDRGRFLKQDKPRRFEGKRRVKSFKTAQAAALYAVENGIESCE